MLLPVGGKVYNKSTLMFRRILFAGSNLLRRFGVNLDDGKNPAVFKMHSAITQLGWIDFKLEFHPDGSWTAESTNVDGIITGGEDTKEINSVLKDAIFTYFEIPPHLCDDKLLRAKNEPVTIEQRVWATR